MMPCKNLWEKKIKLDEINVLTEPWHCRRFELISACMCGVDHGMICTVMNLPEVVSETPLAQEC